MYTMYVNIIQIIPLIMLMLGHTRYEESPPKKRKKERKKRWCKTSLILSARKQPKEIFYT